MVCEQVGRVERNKSQTTATANDGDGGEERAQRGYAGLTWYRETRGTRGSTATLCEGTRRRERHKRAGEHFSDRGKLAASIQIPICIPFFDYKPSRFLDRAFLLGSRTRCSRADVRNGETSADSPRRQSSAQGRVSGG